MTRIIQSIMNHICNQRLEDLASVACHLSWDTQDFLVAPLVLPSSLMVGVGSVINICACDAGKGGVTHVSITVRRFFFWQAEKS